MSANTFSICVSVYKGDEDGGDMYQFHDCPVVPTVGSYFSVATSRDSDGNYREDGKPVHRMDGIVERVSYHFEQRGHSSGTYAATMYVDVFLKDATDELRD